MILVVLIIVRNPVKGGGQTKREEEYGTGTEETEKEGGGKGQEQGTTNKMCIMHHGTDHRLAMIILDIHLL